MLELRIGYKLILAYCSFYAIIRLIDIFSPWWLREKALIAIVILWLIPLIALECVWLWRRRKPFPRLLTHVRYAPIAIIFAFILITISFDLGMVQYSKYQIRTYVYGQMSPEQQIRLVLYNTDRGWCGNGQSATQYWLYADTAAEGFSSPDPLVRARSLRMSIQVYDWLNGARDGPFPRLIKQAEQDDDPHVRQIAAEFLKDNRRF